MMKLVHLFPNGVQHRKTTKTAAAATAGGRRFRASAGKDHRGAPNRGGTKTEGPRAGRDRRGVAVGITSLW